MHNIVVKLIMFCMQHALSQFITLHALCDEYLHTTWFSRIT